MTEPVKQRLPAQTTGFRPRAVAMHGLHSLWDQAIVSVASFATMAFIGRLGKDEMGVFALGISSFWLIAGISNALVWIPYTSRAAHLQGQIRLQFRGDNAGVDLIIAILLATASLLIAGVISLLMPSELWLVTFFQFFSPMVFALTLREHARRIFSADFEGTRLLAFDIPISIAMVLIVSFFYYFDRLNANLAMLLTAVATLPGLYVALRHINEANTSLRSTVRVVATNWAYGKWLVVVAVAWMLSDGLLRWMLVGIKGQQALGAFAGAFLIVSLVNPVLLAMTSFARSVASLKLATGSRLALSTVTIISIRRLAFFATMAFAALHIAGDSFMAMVLGPNYSNPDLVTVLALAVCLEAIVVPVEAFVVALEYGRLLSFIAIARLLVSILMGLIFIPTYGAMGVAVAMLSRSVIVLVMYVYALWTINNRFVLEAESQNSLEYQFDAERLVESMENRSGSQRITASI